MPSVPTRDWSRGAAYALPRDRRRTAVQQRCPVSALPRMHRTRCRWTPADHSRNQPYPVIIDALRRRRDDLSRGVRSSVGAESTAGHRCTLRLLPARSDLGGAAVGRISLGYRPVRHPRRGERNSSSNRDTECPSAFACRTRSRSRVGADGSAARGQGTRRRYSFRAESAA